jgi:MOSC domain-containing protein YiiM
MSPFEEPSPLKNLMAHFAQAGSVVWIGLRPKTRAPMISVTEATAQIGTGLEGDRFSGQADSPRQVTFIQAEHLAAVAAYLGRESVAPESVRRNVVVSGLNLLALKGQQFQIGEAIFQVSGLCHPCSRMEEALGKGGYNAMRSHGGITAQVLRAGRFGLGDAVVVL